MKKYIFLAVSALTLASCQTDDFLGDTPGNNPSYAQKAISFGGTTGKISRAEGTQTGTTAAATLHKNFIVFGTKTVGDNTSVVVYNYYNVNWKTPEGTNEGAWVYEGQDKSPLNNLEGNQSLKYWDYSATKYDFYAFSLAGHNLGKGENDIKVVKDENQVNPTFILTGKVSDLKTCYAADPVSVMPNNYKNKVQFTFRSTGTNAQVSVGIYETISGYDIKEIKFYKADDTKSTQPVLFATKECFSSSEETGTGTLKLIFDKTSVTTELTEDNPTTGTSPKTANLEFKDFSFGQNNHLGTDRISATATSAIPVSPTNIEDGLTMKVDYTLISTDGSGETITVTGATVKVPKDHTNWQPNFHYTYIFKITDSTNGSTGGTGGTPGLNPIVFDAIVSEESGGTHTTVTEFNKNGTGSTTEENTNGEN